MPVAAILILGTIFFYLLEPVMNCQALPAYRRRHALINLAVTAVNLATLAAFGIAIALLSTWATANEIGLSHLLNAGALVTGGPLFIAMLIVYDAVNYWIHRSQHMVDALWPLHRCHHTDPYLDVTSSMRFHPFESIYRALIQGCVVVLLGMNLAQISVYLLFVVSNLLFSHANIKLPNVLDRSIAWIFVTPDLHRVHHSVERKWHDSNYGIVLTVWDRLFGTFTDPREAGTIVIGLNDYPLAEHLTTRQILSDPLMGERRPPSL